MRRSSAPSAKRHHGEPVSGRESGSKCVKVAEAVREGPLRDFHMLGKEDGPDAPVPVQGGAVRRKYTVLWNRPNTKKHKTWEGDGVVEVTENTVYLRNSDGAIITSMPIPSKEVVFEEGMRLTVGSKEVEIVEEICGETEKVQEVVMKPKMMVKPMKSVEKIKERNLGGFLLADPPEEHQRIFNRDRRPVTAVRVVESVAKHLRPHQKEGVAFLYECLMGFHNPDAEYHGAVLADEMGLGKSLQVIATCFTLLRQGPYGRSIARKILIICPSSLCENWSREVSKWLGEERVFAFVVDGKHRVKDFSVSANMPFIILSYEMVTTQLQHLESMIFDVMVCDEGHRLKNSDTKIVQLLTRVACKRRIILTGTPIQNDLHEFFCLVSFVQPDILGTYAEYRANYETPIVNSHAPDASPEFRALRDEKVQELNGITSNVILRRTQMVNKEYLPGKEEVVVFCRPSEIQGILLQCLLDMYLEGEGDKMSPFKVISLMRKICNHPALLGAVDDQEELILKLQEHLSTAGELGTRDSGKLTVLDGILTGLKATGERIVVVSHSTKALDIISGLCQHLDYAYCRLDGSTSSSERQKIVDRFNTPSSDEFIFLLSAKAGGTGLNLVGASRLLLFDADWNPATDLQAMSRIWRDGQTRDVIIYRLITAGTIEERIFQRQCTKNSLSGFVSDSSKDSVSFTDAELKDIFTVASEMDICLTHEALQCPCDGDGSIPEPHNHPEGVQMSDLMQWEHHSRPIKSQVLEELSLGHIADEIVFLFRNQSSSFSR